MLINGGLDFVAGGGYIHVGGGDRVVNAWLDGTTFMPSITNGSNAGSVYEYGSTAKRSLYWVSFFGTSKTYAETKFVIGNRWNASTIRAKFYAVPSSAVAGSTRTLIWGFQATSLSGRKALNPDTSGSAWGTAQEVTYTIGTTDYANFTAISDWTSAITIGGGIPQANDIFFLRMYRDGATDTANFEVYLLGVLLEFGFHGVTD